MKRAPLVRRTPLRGRRPTRERVLFRAVVMERAGGRCEVAFDGVRCPERATQAHHVLPRGRGGTDDHANGLAVCAPHHRWIHAHPDEAALRGYLRHSWQRRGSHVRVVAP